MDKVKMNFIVIIAVLAVLCIVLTGYAASLNSQLSAGKTMTMQLNDRIAGLNAKANDLQTELTSATAKAADEANLVASLQNSVNSLRASLDAANAELNKVKAEYADLESKSKMQSSANMPQTEVK